MTDCLTCDAYRAGWANARHKATTRLVTGEHVEEVARLVFSYVEREDGPTPDIIAHDILEYLAHVIVPFILDDAPDG